MARRDVRAASLAVQLDGRILMRVDRAEQDTGSDRLLRTAAIGAAVAAICCFTPALVLLFGVLGLSHLLGVLDYVLLPALLFFVGLIVYALIRKRLAAAARAELR